MIASLLYCAISRDDSPFEKKSRWVFFLLFGMYILLNIWAFMESLGLDYTKETLLVNEEIIDSWIESNVYQTIGYSSIVVVGMLLPGRLLNRYSKLLVLISVILLVVSIAFTCYIFFTRDRFIYGTWIEWIDFAWNLQMLYFHSTTIYLLAAFGTFLRQIRKQVK